MTTDLPPDSAMLLPKGIVENTAEIYAEVASYPVVPPEKICEYWRVYTTTFRKLIDPTANRLENFWWHVWGSDRRMLSGQQLASLYEQISTGPTFIPLRGPPNRYEGPPIPRLNQHELDSHQSPQRSRQRQQRPPNQESEEAEKSPPPSLVKERAASSAKPPPPHSILKKPRGPSTSGPRPTARFISPHESEDEGGKDGEEASSGSAGLEMLAPSSTKSEKKSTPTITKKFVASSSASKRRQGLARRPSSQSSTGSEVGLRETMSSGSRYSGGQRNVSPVTEHPGRAAISKSQGSSGSSIQAERPALSAKAAGKRPTARSSSDKWPTPCGAAPHVEGQERPLVVQAEPNILQNRALDDVRRNMEPSEIGRSRHESPRMMSQSIGITPETAPRMARSRSHADQPRPRDLSAGRPPPQGLISSSVAATSNVAALGTFDSENPDLSNVTNPGAMTIPDDPPPSGLASRPSPSSLLDSRYTPTQPSPTPAVPFGRSKSQLTLLLEREKARIGDVKPRSTSRKEDNEQESRA